MMGGSREFREEKDQQQVGGSISHLSVSHNDVSLFC